jgi:hypothetical protein
MATPTRLGTKPEIDEETSAILAERRKTIDEDDKSSVDGLKSLAKIRKTLKHPAPR